MHAAGSSVGFFSMQWDHWVTSVKENSIPKILIKNFFEVSTQTFVAPSYPILWLAETLFRNNIYLLSDGWTKDDLVYVWRDDEPVQLAGNLSLPGGFQLGAYGSEYCDVVTATGEFWKLFSALRQFYQVNHNSLMWDGGDWGFHTVFESLGDIN